MGNSSQNMLFIILIFPLVESTSFHNNRCGYEDCSYQLQAAEGNCIIYNTSMCSQMLHETHQVAFKDLTYEDESRFTVSVAPYKVLFTDSKSPLNIIYYAVNTSISIFEKGIHQVALKLTEENSITKCRLFDFRHFSESIVFPVNLFYECFHNFTSKYQFHLEFMSLPTMEKLSYNVIIPPYERIRSLCDWRPSIVIFTGSLEHGTVRIKFSQAPPSLKVSSYEVKFIPTSKVELQTVFKIPADQNRSMLLAEFHPAFSDTYNLSILPLNFEKSGCYLAEMVSIPVGFFKYGIEMKIILYLCFSLFGIGILFFLKYFWNYIGNLESAFQPHVLLIHAINYPEEKKLASVFSDYLSIQHGCKVSSIYGNGIVDPKKRCAEKYRECNVIIIILSKGLFLTLDPAHFQPLEVCDPNCKQLIIAAAILQNQMLQLDSDFWKKKICKVCFSYSSQDDIPEGMKLTTGRCFMLPNELGSFLCFLSGCKHGISCKKYHSSFFISKVNASKEFKALLKAVEAVQLASEKSLKVHPNNTDTTATFACDDNVIDNTSLFLENNLSADSSECDRFTLSLIQDIVQGSSTSIADESETGSDHNESSECTVTSEFLNRELIQYSELETDFMLQQMVNKSFQSPK